jgi:hypothetical protein
VVGRGPLAANALGLGGELVVQRFIGLDFGEIVGDCILDDVGARAALFLSIFLFSTYVRDAGSQVAKSPQVLLPNYVAL